METIEERVRRAVAEQLEIDPGLLKPETRFKEDFNADSLDQVEIVLTLEEEFDLDIPKDGEKRIKTLQDAIDEIERLNRIRSEASNKHSQKFQGG